MVECDLPKVETRVRFPVPAQKQRIRREASDDYVFVVGTGNRMTESVYKASEARACRRVGVENTLYFSSEVKKILSDS